MFEKLKKAFKQEERKIELMAPLSGVAVAISDVSDLTFSEEILGKGIAIKPTEGRVKSPVNGKVSQMFDTNHAVSLISDEGVEILIHIGLDTVELKGEHFTPQKRDGDIVAIGDELIVFDLDAIGSAGYDTVVPIVILNSDDYKDFEMTSKKDIVAGDEIISLVKPA